MSEHISMNKETAKDGTESISYKKSWDKDGIHYCKEVRKVEGGYICVESKYGKPKGVEDAEYIDERKEYVTTENPFEEKKEEKEDEKKMFEFIDLPSLM